MMDLKETQTNENRTSLGTLPRPDWLDKPPEEWPEEAREFYRLCHAIMKRAQLQKRQHGHQASPTFSAPAP